MRRAPTEAYEGSNACIVQSVTVLVHAIPEALTLEAPLATELPVVLKPASIQGFLIADAFSSRSASVTSRSRAL